MNALHTVMIDCDPRNLDGDGAAYQYIRDHLARIRPRYVTLLKGTEGNAGSDILNIAADLNNSFKITSFYFEQRGEPPYGKSNPPFWRTITPRQLFEQYAPLCRDYPIIPHIYKEHVANPGDLDEVQAFLNHNIETMRLFTDAGLTISVGGFAVGTVNPNHVKSGVYDAWLDAREAGNHLIGLDEYAPFAPQFGFGVAAVPQSLFMDRANVTLDKLPDPRTIQIPDDTFLRRGDLFHYRAVQRGMQPPRLYCAEFGTDNIDQYAVAREYLKDRYGVAVWRDRPDGTTQRYNELRGFNSLASVWRAWWNLDFDDALYEVLNFSYHLYTASPAIWECITWFMDSQDYQDSKWERDGFHTRHALPTMARHAETVRGNTPDMPDKPIEIKHPPATDAGWRWYRVSSTGSTTNIRKGPATSAITIDTIPASGRMLQLNMAHKLTLTDGVWIPASPAGWLREDVVRLEPGEPGTIDALPYLRGNGQQYTFSSGERMRAELDANRWYQVKNHQFEEMWYDADYIYRGLDTSPGNGEVYILYERDPRKTSGYGSIWMPRFVNVGDTFKRGAWVQFRQKPNGQPIDGKTYFHESTLKVEALHPSFTFPSGVKLWEVLELRGVDANGPFEAYYYARDFGLVMWKNLRDGKTFHVTQINVTAPPLERESLTWWETMDKTYPPPPAPEPSPDIDELVNERVRDELLTYIDELEAIALEPLKSLIERWRQELQ